MATAPTIEQSDMVQQFAEWVRTKPADEEYDYTSCCDCAFAQFLMERGYAERPIVTPVRWRDHAGADGISHPVPRLIDEAVFAEPETFGALAERLSA